MKILLALLSLSAPPTTFPDTPVGRIAADFVAAIDKGDPAVIDAFVKRHGSRDALSGSSPERLRQTLTHGHRQSGGVVVSEVSSLSESVQFLLTARRGGRSRITVHHSPQGATDFEIRTIRELVRWPTAKDLRAAIRLIRRHLDDLASRDEWSGVVLLASGDRVLLRTRHGLADRALRVPITDRSKFDLASTGKLFTATLIAQEVDRGTLCLDDPIGKWLPDWPDASLREKATVRDLLGHTAGTGTIFSSPNYDRTRRYENARQMAEALHGEKLEFEPGARWSYSNGGFVLLGAILERIHQKPYVEIARERLWKPLGMNATDIVGRTKVEPDLTRIYDRNPSDVFGKDPKELDRMNYGWIGGPHGGGHSTADDLFKFARALRKGELVKPATLSEFVTPGSHNPTYALGFGVSKHDGVLLLGHNGHARSDLAIFWDADITLIVLGNDLSSPAPVIAKEIKTLLRTLPIVRKVPRTSQNLVSAPR